MYLVIAVIGSNTVTLVLLSYFECLLFNMNEVMALLLSPPLLSVWGAFVLSYSDSHFLPNLYFFPLLFNLCLDYGNQFFQGLVFSSSIDAVCIKDILSNFLLSVFKKVLVSFCTSHFLHSQFQPFLCPYLLHSTWIVHQPPTPLYTYPKNPIWEDFRDS